MLLVRQCANRSLRLCFRSIVARRNELLHEMFRMMQSRETLTSNLLDPGQENPHLPAFLQRFDISNKFVTFTPRICLILSILA